MLGFPKNRGSILKVPVKRIIVFGVYIIASPLLETTLIYSFMERASSKRQYESMWLES